MVKNPYTQTQKGDIVFRTFSVYEDDLEFVWHQDREDRIVKILEGDNWGFQIDNQLPIELKPGMILKIPKNTYHRILKGDTNLKIEIQRCTYPNC